VRWPSLGEGPGSGEEAASAKLIAPAGPWADLHGTRHRPSQSRSGRPEYLVPRSVQRVSIFLFRPAQENGRPEQLCEYRAQRGIRHGAVWPRVPEPPPVGLTPAHPLAQRRR
jgi:hypothetical protein